MKEKGVRVFILTPTVHLAYAQGNFHTLLDQDLFLLEAWDQDRERCPAAGIPDEVVDRPK